MLTDTLPVVIICPVCSREIPVSRDCKSYPKIPEHSNGEPRCKGSAKTPAEIVDDLEGKIFHLRRELAAMRRKTDRERLESKRRERSVKKLLARVRDSLNTVEIDV